MLDINGVINSLNSWWSLAYILAFGILGFLGFYTKVKNAELIKDLWGIREREKYKKQLQKMLDSNLLTESERAIFEYDLLKLEYEQLLKLRGQTLPILQALHAYENVTDIVWLYKECNKKLKFNAETKQFEPLETIDADFIKRSSKKMWIGLVIYLLIIGLSYGVLIYSLDFIKIISKEKSIQLVLVLLAISLMLLIVLLGLKVFAWFLKDRFLTRFMEKTLKVSRS